MQWSSEQRVVVGIALISIIVVGNFGIAYQNTRALIDADTWVAHTHEVLAALAAMESELSDAQAGMRGFIITGEAALLAPYRTAHADITPQIDNLRALTADNPVQQKRLVVLGPQIDLTFRTFQQIIDVRQQAGFAAAQQMVQASKGESALIASRQILADMETEERQLLAQRTTNAQEGTTSTILAFAALALLGCALLGVLVLLVHRDRRERQRAERALQAQQSLYELLLQAQSDLGVGVIVANGSHILYANDAFGAITGYSAVELRAMVSPLDLITAEERVAYIDQARRFAQGEDISPVFETTMTHQGGQEVAVQGALQRTMFEGQPALIVLMQDVTARKKADDALNYERYLLDTLMDNVPDSIYFKDRENRFIRISTAIATALHLADPREAIGKSDADFFSADLAAASSKDEQEIIRTGISILAKEEREVWPDGHETWVLTTKMPLRDRHGAVIGTFGVSHDITARKKIERMKNEFVSTVSHELRTPLTSIRGSLGLIAGGVVGTISPQAKALIDIAYSNSERLVRLINDILDIEKIESGKMAFDLQPQELMPLVEQALAANAGYAAHLGVHYVLAQAVPGAQVNVDTDRLIQVLTNLLSNAAKFSPLGAAVELAVTRTDAMLQVAVTDHGPGIPDEFRSRIFQKFAQADSSDTRQKGGTGLGLSICKAIVEHHGGEIGFSTTGPTTFYFTLPDQDESLRLALCDHVPLRSDLPSVAISYTITSDAPYLA